MRDPAPVGTGRVNDMSGPAGPDPAGPDRAPRYLDPALPELLRHFGIDLVFDVGANTGQYALELIEAGYEGRIVSFEPLSTAHPQLLAASQGHDGWTVEDRGALGAEAGTATLHVAGNLQSSSLLGMLDTHVDAAPASRYVDAETVTVRTLDEAGAPHAAAARAPFLKLDVQGFEDRVLAGATTLLPRIRGIQVEMSLVPLYEGEPAFEWWLARLRSLGFDLWRIWPGFSDPRTGRTLQVDGMFFRPSPAEVT